jgi:RNA polymerase sigma-70 factor (ECF subfamily)
VSGEIDWEEIALLYEGLVRIAPRIGLLVGRAVALAEAFNAKMGLAALEALAADERVATYQPYWAARAHVFARLGKSEDAKVAFERAASLTEDARMRRYLLRRADGM